MLKQIRKLFWQLWGNSQLLCCPETYLSGFPQDCNGCPWFRICKASPQKR